MTPLVFFFGVAGLVRPKLDAAARSARAERVVHFEHQRERGPDDRKRGEWDFSEGAGADRGEVGPSRSGATCGIPNIVTVAMNAPVIGLDGGLGLGALGPYGLARDQAVSTPTRTLAA